MGSFPSATRDFPMAPTVSRMSMSGVVAYAEAPSKRMATFMQCGKRVGGISAMERAGNGEQASGRVDCARRPPRELLG